MTDDLLHSEQDDDATDGECGTWRRGLGDEDRQAFCVFSALN